MQVTLDIVLISLDQDDVNTQMEKYLRSKIGDYQSGYMPTGGCITLTFSVDSSPNKSS